jgi:hypothetical protein
MFHPTRYRGRTRDVSPSELRPGQTVIAVAGAAVRPHRGRWPVVVAVDAAWQDHPVWSLVLSDAAYHLDLDQTVTVAGT